MIDDKEGKQVSIVDLLIEELKSDASKALTISEALSKITREWETIGHSESSNEVPVPPGTSVKEFMKNSRHASYIGGFRLSTIFGYELATLIKDSPKWKVTILGETQNDAPIFQHTQKAEEIYKKFVETKLVSLGFIIAKPKA